MHRLMSEALKKGRNILGTGCALPSILPDAKTQVCFWCYSSTSLEQLRKTHNSLQN